MILDELETKVQVVDVNQVAQHPDDELACGAEVLTIAEEAQPLCAAQRFVGLLPRHAAFLDGRAGGSKCVAVQNRHQALCEVMRVSPTMRDGRLRMLVELRTSCSYGRHLFGEGCGS